MPNDFPHISDTDFPLIDTVNAYKYQNDFDYSKYDAVQMEITICSVPWDVGLIHVGNAQIGGLGNVVDFETEEVRDAWFDSLKNKYTWTTKYRAYHTDGYIEVPLPYQKCVLYNYVYVKYHNLPVEYAEGGKDKFFFFIRSCESLSQSNCKIEILRDTWQTYIYSVDIAYLMLQQGHAPMSITTADDYLANPLANNSYLLADDVNYGTTYVSRRANEIILNSGEMYACIVTSASLRRDWGVLDEFTARTPDGQSLLGGQPTMFCYAIEPERLNAFLENVKALIPQFLQTVKAVFFVKQEFVNTTESFEFTGLHEDFMLYIIEQKTNDLQLVELNKTIFGYSDEYADIAKLYTYPYAYLEISDETGNVNQVRIEETEGDISLTVTTSLAYPWINLDGRLTGIGAGGSSVTFSNVFEHSFEFSGDWFNHLRQWSIPTFAVNVEASTVYEYESLYERRQRALENDTALDKAIRSAEAAKDNADASANTSYVNSERSATASKANADASAEAAKNNAVRSATTGKTNADASALTAKENAIRSADTTKTNADNAADARKLNSDANALTAWQNAYNTANTTKTNADNSAGTAKTNADNSARTEKGNSDRTATAARDNAKAIALASKQNTNANAVTAKEIANANAQAEYDNHADTRGVNTILALNGESFANEMTEHGCNLLDYQTSWDNTQIFVQAALQDELMVATFAQNTVQSAIGNTIQGAQAGGFSGGGAIGAGVGAVGGLVATGVGAYFGSSSNAMFITNSLEQNEATAHNNLQKTNNANACSRKLTDVRNRQNKDTVDWTNQLNKDTSERSKDTADANAGRSKDTADANAQRSYDADVANADRMYTAATTNNADSETTALTNAQNAFDTAKTNNDNSCDTAKLNADNAKTTANENAQRDNITTKAANDATNRTAKENANSTCTTALANNGREFTTDVANANETNTTALANNKRTFDTAIDNAAAALETSLENNERTFVAAVENAAAAKDAADAGIQADIDQAGLKAPYQFGEFSNGDTSTTRPIGLFCNVVTQTKDAIEQAGDHFLRFGYNVNRNWKFDGFNLMKHFTYWKAADMWISGNNVPDAYLDELRFFLLGGVCVWRNPDDIGRISIYENN